MVWNWGDIVLGQVGNGGFSVEPPVNYGSTDQLASERTVRTRTPMTRTQNKIRVQITQISGTFGSLHFGLQFGKTKRNAFVSKKSVHIWYSPGFPIVVCQNLRKIGATWFSRIYKIGDMLSISLDFDACAVSFWWNGVLDYYYQLPWKIGETIIYPYALIGMPNVSLTLVDPWSPIPGADEKANQTSKWISQHLQRIQRPNLVTENTTKQYPFTISLNKETYYNGEVGYGEVTCDVPSFLKLRNARMKMLSLGLLVKEEFQANHRPTLMCTQFGEDNVLFDHEITLWSDSYSDTDSDCPVLSLVELTIFALHKHFSSWKLSKIAKKLPEELKDRLNNSAWQFQFKVPIEFPPSLSLVRENDLSGYAFWSYFFVLKVTKSKKDHSSVSTTYKMPFHVFNYFPPKTIDHIDDQEEFASNRDTTQRLKLTLQVTNPQNLYVMGKVVHLQLRVQLFNRREVIKGFKTRIVQIPSFWSDYASIEAHCIRKVVLSERSHNPILPKEATYKRSKNDPPLDISVPIDVTLEDISSNAKFVSSYSRPNGGIKLSHKIIVKVRIKGGKSATVSIPIQIVNAPDPIVEQEIERPDTWNRSIPFVMSLDHTLTTFYDG